MCWSIGYDSNHRRDIGYGVPATCDHPGCGAQINRGLGHVCGGEPYGGERGCGLFFCWEHLRVPTMQIASMLCERCYPRRRKPFPLTPDLPDWLRHKLNDPSWTQWRGEHPQEVALIRATLATAT